MVQVLRQFRQKMDWVTIWATFSQAHLANLVICPAVEQSLKIAHSKM
jgi:hypothetical protein